MDGVSLPTECTSEENEQNAMYDGYTCDTTVHNVLAYGPDGKVLLSALNFPGSWNDGKLSTHFIEFFKRKLGGIKFVSTRYFHVRVRHTEFWWVLFQGGLQRGCIGMYAIIC